MFVYQILVHTPIWVWLLLAFLVSRGVAALKPRDVTPTRMLILPLVFLVWGLTGLIDSRGLGVDFALFVVAFAAGGAGGVALAALGPHPRLNSETGGMAMPGSAIPLTLILVSFAFKYVGTVALAIDSDVSQRAVLVSAMTAVGGIFAGLFWGRTLTLFRRALAAAGARSDLASVAKLIWPRWEARPDPEAS
jgi:hypothetical protein